MEDKMDLLVGVISFFYHPRKCSTLQLSCDVNSSSLCPSQTERQLNVPPKNLSSVNSVVERYCTIRLCKWNSNYKQTLPTHVSTHGPEFSWAKACSLVSSWSRPKKSQIELSKFIWIHWYRLGRMFCNQQVNQWSLFLYWCQLYLLEREKANHNVSINHRSRVKAIWILHLLCHLRFANLFTPHVGAIQPPSLRNVEFFGMTSSDVKNHDCAHGQGHYGLLFCSGSVL